MRISELTEQQKGAFIAKCVARLREQRSGVRWTQKQIVGYLVGTGFCVCGSLWAIALASGRWLAFVATVPWYFWLLLFGLGGAYLFVIAWLKFMLHDVTMRAGERAYLILLFEKCAKENIEFSAEEVVAFLRSVPDSMSLTKGKFQ